MSPVIGRWTWTVAGLALCAAAILWLNRGGPYDTIICYGRIFDGERMLPIGTCAGIRGGRIVRVGWLEMARAKLRINAFGRIVAPGFIDVHTHVERNISPTRPFHAGNFLEQGVTTLITGNCGTSTLNTAALFASLDRHGSQVNVATLVGHNSIREKVMGASHAEASEAEIARMRGLVEQNMREGALGFSTGLEYAPGSFATSHEIVELAKSAGAYGGLYVTHLRDEGLEGKAALQEALEIGRAANVSVHISHLKIAAKSQWGEAAERLAMLDRERAAGRRVTLDLYAYSASSTSTEILLPATYRGPHTNWKRILSDAKSRDDAVRGMINLLQLNGFSDYSHARIAYFYPRRDLNGLTIAQAANLVGGTLPLWATVRQKNDPPSDQIRALLALLTRGGAQMIYFNMSEADVETIMRSPWASFGTDSSVRSPGLTALHPRGTGNFPRILGTYVRERHLLDLSEALRRMTSLAADTFGLEGRGRLREGTPADIVIFDAGRIQEGSNYDHPLAQPVGIDYVLVNGGIALDHGYENSTNFGRALRRTPVMNP